MIGSGKNKSGVPILVGAPVFKDQTGNILLADSSSRPAFAVAVGGGQPNGIVSWRTNDTIERKDWTPIAGTRLLTPGTRYYVLGVGTIGNSGTQQIGIASTANILQLQISPASVTNNVTSVTQQSSASNQPLSPSSPVAQIAAGVGNPNSLSDVGPNVQMFNEFDSSNAFIRTWIKDPTGIFV